MPTQIQQPNQSKILCFQCNQLKIKLATRENQIFDLVNSMQRIIAGIQLYNQGKTNDVDYLLEAISNEAVKHV